jgi:hypothetical protein
MGNTLRQRMGPLPVWAWAGIGFMILVFYLYKKNQKAQAAAQQQANNNSSNLGNANNTSNLTTQAQPMPIQMGDVFVNGQAQSTTPACTPGVALCTSTTPTNTLAPATVPAGPTVTTPQTQAAA